MRNVILILLYIETLNILGTNSGVSLILSLFTVKTVPFDGFMTESSRANNNILFSIYKNGYHWNILYTKQNVCQKQNVICGLILPTSRALLCRLEKVKTDTAGLTLLYLLTQPGTQQNRMAWLGFKFIYYNIYIVINKSK